MDKLNILLVEDEMVIAMDLKGKLEGMGYEVSEIAASYDEALTHIEGTMPDLVVLDIRLKGTKTGIDLGNYIKDHFQIPFIYLTSNWDVDTFQEAKTSEPFAFLKKPYHEYDLFSAIELAVQNFQNNQLAATAKDKAQRESIFVKHKQHYEKLSLKEIISIKADHVYVEISAENDVKRLIRDSLSDFVKSLPSQFVRIHRSYAVNLDHIITVKNTEVILSNKEVIPISKSYRDNLLELLGID